PYATDSQVGLSNAATSSFDCNTTAGNTGNAWGTGCVCGCALKAGNAPNTFCCNWGTCTAATPAAVAALICGVGAVTLRTMTTITKNRKPEIINPILSGDNPRLPGIVAIEFIFHLMHFDLV